jgi:hypothetical protein
MNVHMLHDAYLNIYWYHVMIVMMKQELLLDKNLGQNEWETFRFNEPNKLPKCFICTNILLVYYVC